MKIEEIKDDDKLWDGEEWVSHDGLIYQGEKETLSVNGIHMTPDHKILTEGGWKRSAESIGINWATVSLPDGFEAGREHTGWEESVAVQMYVRERSGRISETSQSEKSSQVMRMHEKNTDQRGKNDTWYVPSSGMGSVAQHEAAMYRSEPSGVEKLWRKGNNCVRTLVKQLRKLLGGYGFNVGKRTGTGSNRQRQGIQPGKLPLGEQNGKYEQQAELDRTLRWFNSFNVHDGRNFKIDTVLPDEEWMGRRIIISRTGLSEPVYDIRNCGPRHRFVVWNGEFPFVVSNCVQGISRDILCYAMRSLREKRICMHIHDELVIEAPEGTSLEKICEVMGRTPPWAEGLNLRADGYVTPWYKKD